MTNSDTNVMRGSQGTFVINDATATTGLKAKAIQVTADTIFSVLKVNGVDALAQHVKVPGNVVKPCVMTVNEDFVFSDITLVSGQVVIVR